MTESNTAYELLADMANQSMQSAVGLPAQVDITPHWSGIGFMLAGHRMVAPMDQVAEILTTAQYTRLPNVQPWIIGVSNVRGRLLPLLDLEAFFNHQTKRHYRARRVLVLELADLYTGLVVEQVMGLQHFSTDTYSEQNPESLQAISNVLKGVYHDKDNQSWSVFSPFSLVKNSAFMNAAIDI